MLHHLIVASSCVWNCPTAPAAPTSAVGKSGHMALGLAFIGLILLFLMRNKGGK